MNSIWARRCPALQKFGWMLVLAACIGGCGRLTPGLLVPELYSRDVPYPGSRVFNFDEYVSFAQDYVDQWDSRARLNSITRQTTCDATDLTNGQKMLFRYWRPQMYMVGPRIEWFEVVILPDEPLASLQIWTSLNTSWDNPPIDLAALTIDYRTAMKLAQERGGAAYVASHPKCFLSMGLDENNWYFLFKEDPGMISDDALRLCIDGNTGEPCDVPADDNPSVESEVPSK